MGIALLGSMMLFGCRKIGETAPETASAGTSYVSEETAGESKTETKATEPPAPTEDPAPEPLVPEAIEPTPAEDALPGRYGEKLSDRRTCRRSTGEKRARWRLC